ncbi:MAG: hypothetical protein E7342_01975 [Clostridiales bacterium]|nr:hypothetical protein [Clostridiales bacterium]
MKTFFKTVAIVTVFSFIEKALGFLYRIYLSRTIGSEGVGIYHIALSIFALLFTICCSGIPITVSRLMTKYQAENKGEKTNAVITAGILLASSLAVAVSLIVFFAKSVFAFVFSDERCMKLFLILLPALTFNAVYAVMRGAFWGNKDFFTYSAIELLEEICMIVFGIILIELSTNFFSGVTRAVVAVLISYLFSFTTSTIVMFSKGFRLTSPKKELKPLIKSSMPITLMRSVSSFISSLVSIILPLRLVASGLTNAEAVALFGSSFGMAMPLLFIPSTLISSFTIVLVPELSTNFYAKKFDKLKTDLKKSLTFTIYISCLFIPVFFVLGEELGVLVYNNLESGIYLKHSAFLMFFLTLSSLTTSVLNSIGLENKTLIFYLISSIFMLLCIWILPLFIGIYALLIGFTFVFGLTTILNFILIRKKCGKLEILKFTFLSILFIIPTVVFGLLVKNLLVNILGSFFTTILLSLLLAGFYSIFFPLFNLFDLGVIKSKIPTLKLKKSAKKPT